MSVLDRIQVGDYSLDNRIKTWLSSDQWTSTVNIYNAVGHSKTGKEVHGALANLLRAGVIEARDIHNTGGRPRTEFRLIVHPTSGRGMK